MSDHTAETDALSKALIELTASIREELDLGGDAESVSKTVQEWLADLVEEEWFVAGVDEWQRDGVDHFEMHGVTKSLDLTPLTSLLRNAAGVLPPTSDGAR